MDEDGLPLPEPSAQLEREVGGVVVEHQPRALGEVERFGQREAEVPGRDRGPGEATGHAERRDSVTGFQRCAVGDLLHHPGHLAARDERQRRLELVLAPGLKDLRKRDPGGLHLNHDPLPGREHMRRLGIRQIDELQRTRRPRQLRDLHGAHGGGP